MDYLIYTSLMIFGFLFLIKGADFFIESASSIAKKFHISTFVIGLTIVAFGTSLPELAVSFVSSITVQSGETADIAMGNVVGSNIVNITLILGLTALTSPVLVSKTMRYKEFPFLIFTMILISLLSLFFQFNYLIIFWESVVLLLAFALYIFIMLSNKNKPDHEIQIKVESHKNSFVYLLLGIILVSIGGFMVTQGSQFIALNILVQGFNINITKATTLVGLSIVAIGTSLPEMVTSIMAAKKGENEIAFGNIIGSNIFNVLFIVGFSGLFNSLGMNQDIITDILLMLLITLIVVVFSITKNKITKIEGIILISIYFIYVIYIINRALSIF